MANIVAIFHKPTYTWPMRRRQAFRYQLQPNGEQQRHLLRFGGSCRFVFNRALALQRERYQRGEKKFGYAGLCKLLTHWRNSPETAWLSDVPVHPLQQSLKDLERAYANFFAKRADFPRFKKRGQHDSFRYPDPKQLRLDAANRRISAQARLGALSQESRGAGANQKRDSRPGGWEVVCVAANRV